MANRYQSHTNEALFSKFYCSFANCFTALYIPSILLYNAICTSNYYDLYYRNDSAMCQPYYRNDSPFFGDFYTRLGFYWFSFLIFNLIRTRVDNSITCSSVNSCIKIRIVIIIIIYTGVLSQPRMAMASWFGRSSNHFCHM